MFWTGLDSSIKYDNSLVKIWMYRELNGTEPITCQLFTLWYDDKYTKSLGPSVKRRSCSACLKILRVSTLEIGGGGNTDLKKRSVSPHNIEGNY